MLYACKLASLTTIAVAVVLTGCSDDGSLTSPDPVMNLRTQVTVTRVEVIKDGDGIEGRGEFYFYRYVGGTGVGWTRNLSSGQSDQVNWTKTMLQRDYTGEGHPFFVEFRCTEYDQNILGDVYADSDMDDRRGAANYFMSPDLVESSSITLGNDRCKVRLHYRITSSLEAAE